MPDQRAEGVDKDAQQRNIEQREALSDIYSALEAQKVIASFSAYTFEEALTNQIERISGQSTKLRPNELSRVDVMESRALQAISQLKESDPELFVEPDEDKDVNTPE